MKTRRQQMPTPYPKAIYFHKQNGVGFALAYYFVHPVARRFASFLFAIKTV